MSVFGALRSGVNGLFAQSQSMAMISDNIANSNTTGYKKVQAVFANMVTTPNTATKYSTGGVTTQALRTVGEQGMLDASSNSTDMAVFGNGFFAVTDNIVKNDVTEQWEVNGEIFYTRAGQFYPDQNGNLRTPQGQYLLGWARNENNTNYDMTNVISNFDVVNVEARTIAPIPTTEIEIKANLQSSAARDTEFQIATEIIDRLGSVKTLTLNLTKTGESATDETALVWDITGTLSDNAYFTQIGMDEDGDGEFDSGFEEGILASDGSGNPLANVNLGKLSFTQDGRLKRYIPPVEHNDIVTVIATGIDTNEDGVLDGIDVNGFDGSERDLEDTDGDASTANIVGVVDLDGNGLGDRKVDLTIQDSSVPPYSVTDNRISVFYMAEDADGNPVYVDETGAESDVPVVKYTGILTQSGIDMEGDFQIILSDGNGNDYLVDHNDQVYELDPVTDVVVGASLGTINADGEVIDNADGTTVVLTGLTGSRTNGAIEAGLGSTVNFWGRAVDDSVFDTGTDDDLADDDGLGVDGVVDRVDILHPSEYNDANGDGIISTNEIYNVRVGEAEDGGDIWELLADNMEMYDLTDLSIVTEGRLFANKYANDEHDPIHEVMALTIDYDGDVITTENGGDRVDILVDFGRMNGNTGLTSYNEVSNIDGVTQNGQQAGSMTSLAVNSDGELSGNFDNGATRNLYMVPVVTFADPLSLAARSDNVYAATDSSGQPVPHVPNTGGAGEIAPASLEASTVDIAEEFTKMIVTQRAYSANTRVITTADDMLTELINSKR